jgi:Fe-S-cluster containining protein
VIDDHDAGTIAGMIHGEVDRHTAERAASAARNGHTMACKSGCNACCANVIMVYAPEAAVAADYLRANRAAREAFLAAYPAWHERAGRAAERIADLHAAGRLREAERAYDEVQKERVMCAFNVDERCVIYPVRPNVCRNTHAIDTNAGCQPGASPGATVWANDELEEVIQRSLPLLRTTQRAAAPDKPVRSESMCGAVHRRLTTTEAPKPQLSRNAPCPCGSGEKWKRCCGS